MWPGVRRESIWLAYAILAASTPTPREDPPAVLCQSAQSRRRPREGRQRLKPAAVAQAPRVLTCANCGRESADHFAYCPACAAPLTPPARQELRKTVTVVSCDVGGLRMAWR